MKYLSFIAVLLLLFSPVAAQSCGDAAVQALPLLEGARSLIEAGNSQGAVALIESAEDLLRNCTTEEPSPDATAAATVEVVQVTSTPKTPATPSAPVGGYRLNPPAIDPTQGIAFVTFVHTSVDSGPLDIYYGNDTTPVVSGLTYGTFTDIVPIQAGTRRFRARPAGSGADGEVLYRMDWNYLANSTWMVTAAGVTSRVAFIVEPISIIRNQYNGMARVRVINLIAGGPRVTVTDSNGKVFGNGLGWVGIRDNMVAPGEYTLSATTGSGAALTEPFATSFEANITYTLFVVGDDSPQRPLTILNLPTVQDTTRVKFINGRADTVDIHARPGNERLVTQIAPGAESDWIELPSGAFTFIAYAPDTGPRGRELAGIATQLRPQRDMLIRIGNSAMQLQSTELRP